MSQELGGFKISLVVDCPEIRERINMNFLGKITLPGPSS